MNENDIQTMSQQVRLLREELDILADRVEKINPRHDAERITKNPKTNEHLGDMSLDVLIQMKDSFEQNFDEDTVKNLHGKEIQEYKNAKKQYEEILKVIKEKS